MKKSLKEMNIFAAQIRKAALRAMNAFHGGCRRLDVHVRSDGGAVW